MKYLIAVFTVLAVLTPGILRASSPSPLYAVAKLPTPVFSTQEIAAIFSTDNGRAMRLDQCGQQRDLEYIAMPGTVFTVQGIATRKPFPVFRVTTNDYPYDSEKGLFIDGRFVETASSRPPDRKPVLPQKDAVVENLLAAEGARYVWGSNWRHGIPELLAFFPPHPTTTPAAALLDLWQFRGTDCSGLLYEATDGFTPRNTSSLVRFGRPVPISGLGPEEIAKLLAPLDLIVWNGHVIIVIDGDRAIESRLACGDDVGVVVSPLRSVLKTVMRTRIPVDDYAERVPEGRHKFVVRRWY